jgi:hypothetical protein
MYEHRSVIDRFCKEDVKQVLQLRVPLHILVPLQQPQIKSKDMFDHISLTVAATVTFFKSED